MDAKKKVLVVEDDDSIRRIIEFCLSKRNFDVVTAADGLDGLSKARSINPDIIILDLMLPKMPGEEVCKQIRKDKQLGRVPVIMVTAKGSDADKVIGKVIGANHYIVKPFRVEELLENINRLVPADGASKRERS